jgi:hypothetical protein
MLEREEVILRYKSISFPYYRKEHEDEKLEEKAHKFEPQIHYVVEQKTITSGIIMFKGVESIFVTRQETIFLPRAKPMVVDGIPMAVRVRYSEPK